jgi:DNA-directed RNA polymerase subunit RPC12/RpoP
VLPVPRFMNCDRCGEKATLIETIPALGNEPGRASYECSACQRITARPIYRTTPKSDQSAAHFKCGH